MRYGLRQFGGIGIQRKYLPQYLAGGCRTCGGKYKKKRRSRGRGRRVRGGWKKKTWVSRGLRLFKNPFDWR